MRNTRFRSFANPCVFLAVTLPLLAQSSAVAPEESDHWAQPPYRVVRTTGEIRVEGDSPQQMHTAYGFQAIDNQGQGQIIAVIEAYDNPRAESDLGHFSHHFNLPECTTANGCFKKIYSTGKKPQADRQWATENSLDIEWAHAIAPQATIILMEAPAASYKALFHAVEVAVANGASVVSMSFGGSEFMHEDKEDVHFNVPNLTAVTSSGDSGHGAQFPAASPYVVAVGGTYLRLAGSGTWTAEDAWAEGGGGASRYEPQPAYQNGVQTTGFRGIPDVAYDASPSSGAAVYSKVGLGGWGVVGGTSIGAPQWAGLFAIANSLRVGAGKSPLTQVNNLLYTLTADFHDITRGRNGTCGAECKAGPGWDFVTGLGTPMADVLIPALVAAP